MLKFFFPSRLLALGLAASAALLTLSPADAASQRAQRVAKVNALLTQASATSKNAAVKQGIAQVKALVARKQFVPARDKVADLKRVAAVNGDNAPAVLKLVDAEEILAQVARKAGKPKAAKPKAAKPAPQKPVPARPAAAAKPAAKPVPKK
ncbi:MAG: hypothetical protein ACK47B_27315 [Armatimonadota bacterium]